MNNVHIECTGPEYQLALGSVTGVRSWNLVEGGLLRSATVDYVWSPGDNRSSCNLTPGRCRSHTHGCGFWAYHDGTEYPSGNVKGVITAWGKTTIGTKGFRAERARVEAIYVPAAPLGWTDAAAAIAALAILTALDAAWVMNSGITVLSALFTFTIIFAAMLVGSVAYACNHLNLGPNRYVRAFRARYPGVRVYGSYRRMLKDFPPSYSLDEVE